MRRPISAQETNAGLIDAKALRFARHNKEKIMQCQNKTNSSAVLRSSVLLLAILFLGACGSGTLYNPGRILKEHSAQLAKQGYLMECSLEARLGTRIRRPVCTVSKSTREDLRIVERTWAESTPKSQRQQARGLSNSRLVPTGSTSLLVQ